MSSISTLNIRGENYTLEPNGAYVVDSYYSSDTSSQSSIPGSWYRVWSDGWVEQGGVFSYSTAVQNQTINLLIPFENVNYTLVCQQERQIDSDSSHPTIYSKAVDKFVLFVDYNTYNDWYACGYIDPSVPIGGSSITNRNLTASYYSGNSWYRIYDDGWVEQGGYLGNSLFENKNITLLVPYDDTAFNVVTGLYNSSNAEAVRVQITGVNTLHFSRCGGYNVTGWWRAEGLCPRYAKVDYTVATLVSAERTPNTWCRVYSDGWCEQGGIADRGSYQGSGTMDVVFPKAFIDTKYFLIASPYNADIAQDHLLGGSVNPFGFETTGFSIAFFGTNDNPGNDDQRYASWEAKGYIREPSERTLTLESETVSGDKWCRIYSDGWCEQGGHSASGVQITFLQAYKDANYTVVGTPDGAANASSATTIAYYSKTASSVYFTTADNVSAVSWETKGYIR